MEYSALFRARYVDVLRFIERRVASPEDAAELAADVFRIAWQRFEPGEASRAWLFGIARNVVLEHYRMGLDGDHVAGFGAVYATWGCNLQRAAT